MIKKLGSGKYEYLETADGREFKRIVGGLAWPHSGKPGFTVVIGENLIEDIKLRVRHLTVIKEMETIDVAGLVRQCQDWQAECLVEDWFGNRENKPMWAIYSQITKDEPNQRRFNLFPASHAGDPQGMGYYMPMIKEYRKSPRTLHFQEGSKLERYLDQTGAEALNHDPSEFPAIVALGYALAYFYEHKSDDDEDDQGPQPSHTGRNRTTGY
jgi:hypothetical protein